LVDPDSDTFLGRLSIRHHLNPSLEQLGGHIGYEIRPSARGKGYGRLILQLGLDKARALGLTRALLTCDATNILSQRVIRANGGVLQDQISLPERPNPVMRWWIDL
jgi:predicted acetyltransferase